MILLLHLRIILRNFKKNLLFSAITIFGLTVGMTGTVLILTYVRNEFSYDKFHKNAGQIYRINSIITRETEEVLPICIGLNDGTLQKQVPEIEELLQIYEINSFGETEFTFDNVRFKNINMIYSNPNIHKVFTLNYLRGNPDEALVNPYSIVITQKLSNKMFGSIETIGKTFLTNYSKELFTVTGVIEDYPSTSHLKIDAIAPLKSVPFNVYNQGCELNTYVLFRNKINPEEGINKTMISYKKLLSQRMTERGYKSDCFLQKLTDIHLHSDFQSKGGVNSEYKKVFIYLSLALIVLIIAIINFINLLTAHYEVKSKDTGIQRAMGGSRVQIITAFLLKSFIFSFVSIIFVAFLVEFLVPKIGFVLDRDMISTYHNNVVLFVGLPLLALIVGLISGIYPAFLMSRYSPDNLIKGNLTISRKRFTQVLVVMQFSIMIFLLISLMVMKRQIIFMKNADLGFNAKGVIAISDFNGNIAKSYSAIKDALKSIPDIKSIGASYQLFGDVPSGQYIDVTGNGPKKEYPIKEYRIFPGFFETLSFIFVAGRSFDENIQTDKTAVVLNETAIKKFGLTDPLNSEISLIEKMHVIGIVKDFHFNSLEESIEPIMFTYYNDRIKNLMLKISGNDTYNVLLKVEKIIKEFDPGYVLDFTVLEDYCRNRYSSHEQMETLSTFATIFSLILAMLGLYALTAIMIQNRAKEIALRKINGATRIQVLQKLIKVYVLQISIAFVISTPIGWYLMHGWLENFAYRTGLRWWIFTLVGIMALSITLITVILKSWRAATKNPVEALRSE